MAIDVNSLYNRKVARDRWNRVSIGDIFERVKLQDPDRIVIEGWPGTYENEANSSLTAGSADSQANKYAHALIGKNVTPGDIVMMVCENSVEALIAKIGIVKSGATVAPINPNLSIDIICELIELCKPVALVIDDEYAEKIRPISEEYSIPIIHYFNISSEKGEFPSFGEFIEKQNCEEPDISIGGEDIWELLFTSGSTSAPKGTMVSHHNTMYFALSYSALLMNGVDYESEISVVSFLPIVYHVGNGFFFSAVLNGGRLVLGRKFNANALARAVDKHKVTCLWIGAPHAIEAVVSEFAKNKNLTASTVRTMIYGWAPMAPELYERVKTYIGPQVKVIEIIGQTEVCAAHRFWTEKYESIYLRSAPELNYVGEPHPLLGCMIVNEEGEPIEYGNDSVGEAVYRSPTLMAGYYKQPQATQDALRGGWFHGGDAFRWGEGRQRILSDRIKDIIKSGGENVTCIRVEAILNMHSSIKRSAIVGIPHSRWGEAVTAFVIPEENTVFDELEVLTYLKTKLSAFEIPKKFVLVEAFPEAVGGKIQKHVIRAKYANLYKDI